MIIVGAALLLAGSVYGSDWMNYFNKTSSLYPAIAKPGITLLAFFLVLMAGKDKLERKDWALLLLAFLCMLPTDILMSLVVVDPNMSVGGWVFMVGGGLSVLAHLFLIIRVGRGLGYLKHFKLSEIWLPVIIYASALIIMLVLWQDLVRVGHAVIGPDLHGVLLHHHVVCLGDGAPQVVSPCQCPDGGICRHLLVRHRDPG